MASLADIGREMPSTCQCFFELPGKGHHERKWLTAKLHPNSYYIGIVPWMVMLVAGQGERKRGGNNGNGIEHGLRWLGGTGARMVVLDEQHQLV